jgi:hypothetical protein
MAHILSVLVVVLVSFAGGAFAIDCSGPGCKTTPPGHRKKVPGIGIDNKLDDAIHS